MREILFRGKQRTMLDWVEGTGVFNDGTNTWLSANEPNKPIACGLNHKIVLPETVGQFTGLTDKNGKKIFEGDIVEVIHVGVYLCRWDEGNCEFGLINENESLGIAYVSPYDIVVIGNIHDDPELLEVTADG